MNSTDDNQNLYGYTPTRSVCIIFVILYAVSTLLHGYQSVRSRALWLLPTVVLAGTAEVVGWVARTKSSYDPLQRMPFVIQTSILVLAPTPFVAALFIGFGRITGRLGAQYSRLSPALYSKIFLTADIVSLFVQGGGGGIASSGSNDADKVRLGSNIIIAGLVVQLFSMSVFCFFMGEYVWRRINDRPFHKLAYSEAAERNRMDRHMKMLLAGITISTVLIYIRSIYRIIEFADGFDGSIAHTQVLFNVFDGMLVTLAMYTLNFMHPGMLLLATQQMQSYPLNSRTESY
ncbi:RTA1-domain-containing protein [Lentinus tigrinus ALCF2SS1-7]|uniref:RTA1-domain-containing protein n=1 Tax=Lentinus tigrinus ALCF2SS1-7 TaxID=1328758 RepID=UPI001165E40F|nr:RTA1-domain-containing protein [Lentinus tigrinus ALCF2SS1-7]